MSIFRRREAEPQTEVILHELEGTQESPEDFVRLHAEQLNDSRERWTSIASRVRTFVDEGLADDLRPGIIENYRAGGNEPDEEVSNAIAANMAEDLAVSWLVSARSLSSRHLKVFSAVEGKNFLIGMPNPQVKHAVQNMPKPRQAKLILQFSFAFTAMNEADRRAGLVLHDMCESFLTSRERAEELHASLTDEMAYQDTDFKELRRMITVDWSHPDPTRSVLRTFLANVGADQAHYAEQFVQDVLQNPNERRNMAVRQMAAFAIASSGNEPLTDANLHGRLINSYQRWPEISVLDQAFRSFAQGSLAATESFVQGIAGRSDPKDIRTHRSPEVVQAFFESLQQRVPETRAQRRRKPVKQRVAKSGASQLISAQDIIEQTAARERQVVHRNVMVTKGQNGSTRLVAIEPHQVSSHFMDRNASGTQLEEDVHSIVEYLRTTDRLAVGGLRRMRSGGLTLQDSKVGLWRFAPDKTPGLRVSSQNRFLRAVVGFRRNDIIFADLLPHDQFDKKYPV